MELNIINWKEKTRSGMIEGFDTIENVEKREKGDEEKDSIWGGKEKKFILVILI